MSRGSQTAPDIKEKAISVYAKTGNYAETERKTGVPDATVYDLVNNDDDFGEFRKNIGQQFVIKSWRPLVKTIELLEKKIQELTDQPNLNNISIKDLTGSVKDLRTSIENVQTVINANIQINNYDNSPETLELEAIELLSKDYIITRKQTITD